MVVREPRILELSVDAVTERLFTMKVSEGGSLTDVLRAVESEPALLLSDSSGSNIDCSEAATHQLTAWRHGQLTDNDAEWERRYLELQAYAMRHGDAHVGYRNDDNPGLTRWARTQRSAYLVGTLSDQRLTRLHDIGFEMDDEMAEWMRWFSLVKESSHDTPDDSGLSKLLSDVGQADNFYAANWSAVQRIAHRCDRLSQDKVDLLDSIGFDWSGADPLS